MKVKELREQIRLLGKKSNYNNRSFYNRNWSVCYHRNYYYYGAIDLFTDTDAIFNFCPVDFCLKWTLYFVSTSKIMIGNQFSINFDFQKLSKISVQSIHFYADIIYPVASENFTTLDKSLVKGFL